MNLERTYIWDATRGELWRFQDHALTDLIVETLELPKIKRVHFCNKKHVFAKIKKLCKQFNLSYSAVPKYRPEYGLVSDLQGAQL